MTKKKLNGRRCQCPSCGLYMNSIGAFDAHRHQPSGSNLRVCFTSRQMEDRGMTKTADGFWTTGGFANVPWSKSA